MQLLPIFFRVFPGSGFRAYLSLIATFLFAESDSLSTLGQNMGFFVVRNAAAPSDRRMRWNRSQFRFIVVPQA